MTWECTKLSEFLFEREERIKYEDANQLGLQRIKKIDFSGNIHLDTETDTKTDMIRLRSGDLVISGINAAKGAIAVYEGKEDVLATIHYSAYKFNPERISVDFLKWYFKSPEFSDLLKEQIPGGIKTELKPKHILPLQVKMPQLSEQKLIADRINHFQFENSKLEHEITHQKTLLAKLKQAILQEAIHGTLTKAWRTAHPEAESASQLLRSIHVEKERLIAAKKLRSEKPILKITADEIPFEIPQSWRWCRIAEATLAIVDCPHSTPQWTESGFTCVKTGQFRRFHLDLSSRFYVSQETYNERVERLTPKSGDILYSREGSILGIACRIPEGEKLCLGQRMMLLRTHDPIASAFIEMVLNSPHVTRIADESILGGCAPHINVGEIKAFVIPLPPLAEQAAIVERVEGLMAICRALEAEIEKSHKHAGEMLQAILKEAFAPAVETVCKPIVQQNQKTIPVFVKQHSVNSKGRAAFACYALNVLKGDKYLGRTKMVKIEHFAEYHCCLDLGLQPIRDKNGPVDIGWRMDAEKLAGNQNWYSAQMRDGGKVDYLPGAEISSALEIAEGFMGEKRTKVDALLALMSPLDTKQCEIIATLYASWNDFLLSGKNPLDDEIVDDVWNNWHPDKKNIPKRDWKTWLGWLRKKKLIPEGKGRPVPHRAL